MSLRKAAKDFCSPSEKENLCVWCGLPVLIDCSIPDLCDRLNLTIAVGNFTIQESAVAYKCICGKTSLRRLQSTVAYSGTENRNVNRPNPNPMKDFETSQDIEIGWDDKEKHYEGWEPNEDTEEET